jgi:hypothetical protein
MKKIFLLVLASWFVSGSIYSEYRESVEKYVGFLPDRKTLSLDSLIYAFGRTVRQIYGPFIKSLLNDKDEISFYESTFECLRESENYQQLLQSSKSLNSKREYFLLALLKASKCHDVPDSELFNTVLTEVWQLMHKGLVYGDYVAIKAGAHVDAQNLIRNSFIAPLENITNSI